MSVHDENNAAVYKCRNCGKYYTYHFKPEEILKHTEGKCKINQLKDTKYMTRIVNKNIETYDVYIGRGSIFGNPYEISRDGTREEVIERYKKWFYFLLRDEKFRNEIIKLKGKKLGCFYKPAACHGDIIKICYNYTKVITL